jgi:hypothetical protein
VDPQPPASDHREINGKEAQFEGVKDVDELAGRVLELMQEA